MDAAAIAEIKTQMLEAVKDAFEKLDLNKDGSVSL